jgi:starvation-inducible DNA-binding protein
MAHSTAPPGLEESAEEISTLLQDRLGSLVDLVMTLKHIHWNVVGPGFIATHEMLDDHVVAIREMADQVAERIATLGGVPNGLAGYLVEHRTWDDYPVGRDVVAAHLAELDRVYDGIISDHRAGIEKLEPIDPITVDILTQQSGTLELYQWFVRAHLEDKRS